jgi:hypothetical protein
MSNNKQTAIDIFKEKLIDIFEDYHDGIITLDEYIESINKATQQAKEMEKEQMQHWFGLGMHLVEGRILKPIDKFEENFNETYGGNK